MQKPNLTVTIIVIAVVLVFGWIFFYSNIFSNQSVDNIDTIEEEIPTNYSNLIVVTSPLSNSLIESPLTITGEARGQWYFEATFPITLLDEDGSILVETFATAKGEWMTENFVPFDSIVTFPKPKGLKGTLIIRNSNPSGMPENDKFIEIPVLFK